MLEYHIEEVRPGDRKSNRMIDDLLEQEGIQRDANLDYTCALYDENGRVAATGSCFGNTLRCLAVSHAYQGRGLLNKIVSHLVEVQCARGNAHLFVYTKCQSAKFFRDLGFYEIARVDGRLVFMENRRTGFRDYLKNLEREKKEGKKVAAVVMNANPFTLGHQYLIEKASAENDVLHVFILDEEASLVPFPVRKRLVMEGTAHLPNICYHDSGPYIISSATFPSYFLKDRAAVIEGHARLDLAVFVRIAHALNIKRRYVGEEPTSRVTGIYNRIMRAELPEAGIDCVVVPRKKQNGRVISASTVRSAIHEGHLERIREMVPPATYRYFTSSEAAPVIARIVNEREVVHY